MNKKDLADIRKEFKLNTYSMPIKEVYSIYLKKDNAEIITRELKHFDMMDIDTKELYLENFKRVLTGTIDIKIFELNFNVNNTIENLDKDMENECEINSTQSLLYGVLSNKINMAECCDIIVDKISKNYNYDTDVVINFVKAEYYKGNKKKGSGEEEDINDYLQAIEFILCSINKVEVPKKVLKFDYSDLTFKPNSALDVSINLKSPLDGFMFPSFSSQYVDVNKLIYYSSRAKEMNASLVEQVLECGIKPTAIEEKESFNAILNTVVGDKIKPDVMQEIYERINEKLEIVDEEDEEEEPTVDMKQIKTVLEESGVENTEMIETAFDEICGSDYEFKVKNIVPDFKSKSIKIENETTNITITPRDLSGIKQIRNKEGRKCLLIELTEDVQINGFKLETEEVDYI